jgi:hypothetical protein
MPGIVGGEEVQSEPEPEDIDNNKKVSCLCVDSS